MTAASFSYDALPYPDLALPNTHPNRLNTAARLYGLRSPDVATCRVLELGCGTGANLLSIAYGLPKSRCVGVDLSSRQIAHGRKLQRAVGIENLSLHAMDVLQITKDFGEFDYIVANGLYTWVPPEVQSKVLAICKENLARNGVAFVSYNTFPGSHARLMARRMLLYHTRDLTDQTERARASRGFLGFVSQATRDLGDGYRQSLAALESALRGVEDSFVVHELLDTHNEPLYFHEFNERIVAQGLQYIGDTTHGRALDTLLSDKGREYLAAIEHRTEREQYLDFLVGRKFRDSLVCHARINLGSNPKASALRELLLGSAAICANRQAKPKPGVTLTFRAPNGVGFNTDNVLTQASLLLMRDCWPRHLELSELFLRARKRLGLHSLAKKLRHETRNELLHALEVEVVDAQASPPRHSARVSTRPLSSELARIQAGGGAHVTSLFHTSVGLDEVSRLVLFSLDGTRSLAEVGKIVGEAIAEGTVSIAGLSADASESVLEATARAVAKQLAECALLLA